MPWNSLLAGANAARTLARARSAIGRRTVYALGKGGFDPTLDLTRSCDCSGFVAWAIGIPRELPPGSGRWLSTDEYWRFPSVPMSLAAPGDLLVYPDHGGRQGHIGIVATAASGPQTVIHCSSGNYRRYGDAVRETSPAVFTANPRCRLVRVDYDKLRGVQRTPRLILATRRGAGYEYRAVAETTFRDAQFFVAPWQLGLAGDESEELVSLLKRRGIESHLALGHLSDPADPRAYLFVDLP